MAHLQSNGSCESLEAASRSSNESVVSGGEFVVYLTLFSCGGELSSQHLTE